MLTLRRFFSLPPTLPDELRSNFIHLYWDIGWWGLYTGSIVAFLSIYATRSGATAQQIGLLSALPALVSLLISLPAGRVLRRFAARPAAAWAAFLSRIQFLFYALLPWLLPPSAQVDALLVLSVLIAIPTTFIGISYGQFFMEGIPSEWRGTVVSTRNAILAVVTLLVTLLCGQILTRMPFPSGYQVVFAIGFVGAIFTAYHISQVRPVDQPAPPAAPPETSRLPGLDGAAFHYIKILGLLFLFNLVNSMAAPLIPDILVHRLNLSDAIISFGAGFSQVLVFWISLFMARFTRRAGNRRATALGVILLAIHALALALATDITLFLLSAMVAGVAAGVLNTAQYNYHLEAVPEHGRPTWLSWSFLLGNAAVLLGALLGPQVAHLTGTPAALLFFGGLRLVFGLAIFRWG